MSLINIERTIELDVYDHDTTPSVIKAIQMDEGTRTVFAMIQSSRQIYDIGQNAAVSLTVLRPDKTKVQITGQTFGYAGTDGTMYGAKAELSDVALAVKGNLKAQFKITSGDQELRTEIFTINNGEALDVTDGDWAGDLDGHNLDEMAQDIEDAKAAVSEMETDVSELKSGLNQLDERYKADTKTARTQTVTTINWTDGKFYNLTTGVYSNSPTMKASPKYDCAEGDIIILDANQGQMLFFASDGSLSSPYIVTSRPARKAIVIPANTVYFAFNNSNADTLAASFTHYVTSQKVDQERVIAPARLLYDNADFINANYASVTNGTISSIGTSWYCGITLPCEASHKYRTESQVQVVFYDSTLGFISAILPNNSANYTGAKVEMDFETPSNAAYMSINSLNAHEKVFDIDAYTVIGNTTNPFKLRGKTVVCFGDSITGNYGFGDNYPYQIEKYTGAKVYNVGFGGCRMELLQNDAQHTNPFSMCGIVNSLESGDWTDADAYAESISKMVYLRLQILKAIDWSKVDIVTIAYGTNEGGYPQDDEENPTNKYTYGGATRYAVNKLLTLYPHLRIVLLTPIYRFYTSEGVDSDTHTHPTYGGKLTDNVETLIKVGGELKVPVLDLYHTLGINITNYTSYFGDDDEQSDGTHINSFGREQMGRRVAGELMRLF